MPAKALRPSRLDKQSLPRDFEITTRRFSLGLQIAGTLLCVMAWAVAPRHYHYLAWPLIALTLTLNMTIMLASLSSMLAVMSIINVWILSLLFSLLLAPSPNSSLWSFSLCMSFTLILAPLFLRYYEYGLAAGGVNLIFGGGHFPVAVVPGDFNWTVLMNVTVLSIGLSLNIFFAKLHQRNFQAKNDLENLAYTDPLTGIGNRRMLIEALDDLCSLNGNNDRHFLMIDVDDFKSINDKFGHEKGDAVLVEIAQKLETVFGADCVARMGGEEFGVLMASDGVDQAYKLATSFLAQVREIRAGDRPVTVSVGITGMARTPTDIMRFADEALYQAKKSGKDKAIISDSIVRITSN